jgi:hypothetical protein
MQGEDVDRKEDVFGTFLVVNIQHMPTKLAPPAIENPLSRWVGEISMENHGLVCFRLSDVLWAMFSGYEIKLCGAIILSTPMCEASNSTYLKEKALRLHRNRSKRTSLEFFPDRRDWVRSIFIKGLKINIHVTISHTWMQPKSASRNVSSAAKHFDWQWTYDNPEIRISGSAQRPEILKLFLRYGARTGIGFAYIVRAYCWRRIAGCIVGSEEADRGRWDQVGWWRKGKQEESEPSRFRGLKSFGKTMWQKFNNSDRFLISPKNQELQVFSMYHSQPFHTYSSPSLGDSTSWLVRQQWPGLPPSGFSTAPHCTLLTCASISFFGLWQAAVILSPTWTPGFNFLKPFNIVPDTMSEANNNARKISRVENPTSKYKMGSGWPWVSRFPVRAMKIDCEMSQWSTALESAIGSPYVQLRLSQYVGLCSPRGLVVINAFWCELKRLNSSADTTDVYTVLCAKYKHEKITCANLAAVTMESRRLFEAASCAVGEVNDVLKVLIVAAEL